jgi:tetratricopeptide (TPR) repeat protein
LDIWQWVEQLQRDLRKSGNDRLARLIDQIPHEVVNNRPERASAALTEALAAARALKNPWLEVFLRHWGMQNRMANRGEGEAALSEAASLLEFAHRKETAECPQSVCVTQDIAGCYGRVDGPGWADERLAVCSETLARIDATWVCFDCISREYADGLVDSGRAGEAVAYLERQAAAMEDAGEEIGSRYRWRQASAMRRAGRAAEALALLEEIDKENESQADEDRVSRSIDRASALVDLGRADEARTTLPLWEAITPGDYPAWSVAACSIAAARPEFNQWSLGNRLQSALDHLVKVGAHRDALELAVRHGKLALQRGAPSTAQRCLELARAELPRLHKPLDGPALVDELAAAVAAGSAVAALPVPTAELAAYLERQENRNPEQEIEWLSSALRELPEDEALAVSLADALLAVGRPDAALEQLWAAVERRPASREPVYRVLRTVSAAGDGAAVERLLALVEPVDAATACWIRAWWALTQERWADVGEHAARMLEVEDDDDARRLWAAAAMKAGDFGTAVRLRRELLARATEPGNDVCFDLMTAASAARDWQTVRETAALLKMDLEGESGPIEESWGRVNVVYRDGVDEIAYGALRTGPVTARIVEPAAPRRTQHAGDWVVFDAAPLEKPPEDEEERRRFILTFRLAHVLEPGQYDRSWLLDGPAPSDEEYAALRDELWSMDLRCWWASGESYHVTDPNSTGDGKLPGMLALVAAPKTMRPKELHRLLKKLTASWRSPVCWKALAEAAGEDVDEHASIEKRYGL